MPSFTTGGGFSMRSAPQGSLFGKPYSRQFLDTSGKYFSKSAESHQFITSRRLTLRQNGFAAPYPHNGPQTLLFRTRSRPFETPGVGSSLFQFESSPTFWVNGSRARPKEQAG